jgi:hypothetical protein
MTSRGLREASKSLLRKVFELGQHLGVDVLPRHFYSEVPDIRQLRTTKHWKVPFSMAGVAGVDAGGQLAFVRDCCPADMVEELTVRNVYATACKLNGDEGFGPVEADFLYAFVATTKPRQIFQIGCGVSTAVCLMAAERAGYAPDLLCVEPYPTEFLVREQRRGRITLIREKAQLLDLALVSGLGADLLFFVDSTHTLGPAGEVSRIIAEMLPRLKAGARVHFHDITFPYDYNRDLLRSRLFFWHESVLLHAFLAYNARFRILASLSMLHYSSPLALRQYLPNYEPEDNDEGLGDGTRHFPSSTYLQVVT